MRDSSPESRRGAALMIALVVIVTIVAMIVFFLEQSLGYSRHAAQDTVDAVAIETAELGLAMAYQRLRNGFPLDNEIVDEYESPAGSGRWWTTGDVSGKIEHANADGKSYTVNVAYSDVPPLQGRADGGSSAEVLVDLDLVDPGRPDAWFKGKKFMMLTGELAGITLEILSFDGGAGRLTFEPQKYAIVAGDKYEIPGGKEYQFKSEGKNNATFSMAEGAGTSGTTRHIETWWWRQSRPLKKYGQRGAVVANGFVEVSGNIEIDGRDHCANGGRGMPDPDTPCLGEPGDHHILDPGVKGISSTGTVDQKGSSGIGGDGDPPAGKGDSPSGIDYTEQFPDPASIDNDSDDDGDGPSDEDPYNGVDDDRVPGTGEIVPDGDRDEDTRFPKTPDEALALPDGTLRGIAEETGTYFTSEAAFDDYYRAHGRVLPGGRVYYLNFPKARLGGGGGGYEMDMTGTDEVTPDKEELKPIIFIHHFLDSNGEPSAIVKPLQVVMKGLLIMDGVSHINAGTRIIGGVQTLSDEVEANVFGNGQAKIWYSSAALANLPDDLSASSWNSSSWVEEHPKKK